jgi:hypothetical protein
MSDDKVTARRKKLRKWYWRQSIEYIRWCVHDAAWSSFLRWSWFGSEAFDVDVGVFRPGEEDAEIRVLLKYGTDDEVWALGGVVGWRRR